MNRSILIVICDFLLVSLLTFSTLDMSKVSDQGTERRPALTMVPSPDAPPDPAKDLAAVMRLALDEERKTQAQLQTDLARAREEAARQQAALTQRDRQAQSLQQELQAREQKAQRLDQERAALEAQFAAALTNIATLNQQLRDSAAQAVLTREKLSALQDQVRGQTEQSGALRQQLTDLTRTNQAVLAEKERLANQLQLAEAEKRFAAQQLARMEGDVKAEREEKARLAESVKTLAAHSSELAKEVRDNRPLAPNAIFNELSTNRLETRFCAMRPGLFGETTKTRETETVLVSDGTNIFALCHVQDTPLSFGDPGFDWDGLTGTFTHGTATCPIGSLSFSSSDPRIVLMPVSAAQARQLGCKVYRVSADPYKFQDAVLVGTREGYYGQCNFQIDLTTPDYVKLDRNVLKGLFGKFNPSRGDLVFSKSGELLGVMANSSYCLMLRQFYLAATVRCGPDVSAQHTGFTLSSLYSQVMGLPFKLQ